MHSITLDFYIRVQTCLFFKVFFLSSRPLHTMGIVLEIWIARRKCLCVSGKVALWSKHLDIIFVVSIFYLKFCNHTCICYLIAKKLYISFENLICSRKSIVCFETRFQIESMFCFKKVNYLQRNYDFLVGNAKCFREN